MNACHVVSPAINVAPKASVARVITTDPRGIAWLLVAMSRAAKEFPPQFASVPRYPSERDFTEMLRRQKGAESWTRSPCSGCSR